ncbi:TlpA family protein disulfide reductase [Terrimonas alba]|uniref:TlpA family protein disulfide reductase n=1 Tax=Terrimonas alba TaxID=3349636 RepID=UPI0035F4EAE2
MHTLKYIAQIGLVLITIQTHSQQKQLSIGDKLPLLTLPNTINNKSGHLNFADYKGKSIILDFWNQRCAPCIAAFPHLDSLQQQFDNDIQLILVNKESKDSTINFFARRKKIKMPSLPMITGDTLLSSMFPSEGYPYHVWIDRNGTISYFSGGYNTTVKHISDFLEGTKLKLKNPTFTKRNDNPAMNTTMQKGLIYYSAISRCSNELDIGNVMGEIINEGKAVKLSVNCSSVLDLYKLAFEEKGKYSFAAQYSLNLQVADKHSYIPPLNNNKMDDWLDNHAFNYQLIVPAAMANNRFKIMQQDLQRFFDLDAKIEIRKVKSLVLKHTRSMSSSIKPVLLNGDSAFHFINQPLSDLINFLEGWIAYEYPFINELDEMILINAIVKASSVTPLNPSSLMQDLHFSGLELCWEERDMPVLSLSQKKNQ